MTDETAARRAVTRLLTAIESRDLRAISAGLHPDATWQNVPHPPAAGRAAVIEMLAPIITWSDRVQWDIRSESYRTDVAWVERVDRFWIDDAEYAVRCNGVMVTDGDVVRTVRDYSDLGGWRARIGPVLDRLGRRHPPEVVRRHLDAVISLDPIAMAADYALDAVLQRGDVRFVGHAAIADYFDTVPERLGTSALLIGDVETSDHAVTVAWRLHDAGATIASGHDDYAIEHGRITHQVVTLDGSDF